jgi:hypothetical protein
MYMLGRSLGADYIQFRPIVSYRQDTPGVSSDDTEWVDNALEHLNYLKDAPDVSVDIDRFEQYRDWQGHNYKTCWFSALSTVITPNGKVWECCNKREHEAACLGDLTIESFIDIWQRSAPAKVNGSCRIMCRGHIANQTLDLVMTEPAHRNFI